MKLLKSSQVVIVQGATGSGKSTQLPQFILESSIAAREYVNIICTQPRRISAIGLATRVAAEQASQLGQLVGYQVRLDNTTCGATHLAYVTVGILLRQLLHSSSTTLSHITHIIVDELHERSLDIDVLLLILKHVLSRNPHLKLILMSATLDTSKIQSYFLPQTPILQISGRTFPVVDYFLEDILQTLSEDSADIIKIPQKYRRALKADVLEQRIQDVSAAALSTNGMNRGHREQYSSTLLHTIATLNEDKLNYEVLEALIWHIVERHAPSVASENGRSTSNGSILVFLDGIASITRMLQMLTASYRYDPEQHAVIPLHGQLSTAAQNKIFQRMKQCKIILSTNIAETSITIDDCIYVIDSGKQRVNTWDSDTRITALRVEWVSQSNAKQRSGRAGRVQSGYCFKLYSKYQYQKFDANIVPEIKRIPLEHVCLQLKLMTAAFTSTSKSTKLASLLQSAVDIPEASAIVSAVSTLNELGALNSDDETLTTIRHTPSSPACC